MDKATTLAAVSAEKERKQERTLRSLWRPRALRLPFRRRRRPSAREFGFRGPTTLHDGELVRFEDDGFLVHMDVAFPVKSRSAATKVVEAATKVVEALKEANAGSQFDPSVVGTRRV